MAVVLSQPVGAPPDVTVGDRQVLNAPDRLMAVAHQGLRAMGHAGFLCQTHVWTKGRIDMGRLADALGALSRRYPVVTSRLVNERSDGGPAWRFRPGAECALHEATLDRSDPDDVRRHAEALFARETDLDRVDPIDFHVLHLPDDRDVLIVRWCHALMDGKAPELVIHEIDRLASSDPDETLSEPASSHDEILAHLRRASRWRRMRCALRVVGGQIRLPVRSVTLVPPDAPAWVVDPPRIAVRTLDAGRTDALTTRVKRLCGFANLAPAVLASAYRVTSRMSPRRQGRRTVFQTDVPLNLRPPGATSPVFRNFMSFVSLRASFAELGNRDELTKLLSVRMRDQLRRGIDLGNMQMMLIMSRWAAALTSHIKDRLQRKPLTLGFGYLGPVAPGLRQICGASIDNLYTLNSTLSPPGMTLQGNQFGGRLNLALAYIDQVIPESTAGEFLDSVVRDLLA